MKEFINVGQITKPHGVRGEVKVYSLADSLDRFKTLKSAYIDGELRKITSCKLQNDRVILKIEGIDSVEDAEGYRNKYLMVPREEAVKLEKGSYYVADLIDCTVLDENGEILGKVCDVLSTPGNDIYWVKGDKKGMKEILIPALKEIVVKIDIEKSEIIIKPVDTWLE